MNKTLTVCRGVHALVHSGGQPYLLASLPECELANKKEQRN